MKWYKDPEKVTAAVLIAWVITVGIFSYFVYQDEPGNITLSQAFAHCFKMGAYWWGAIPSTLLAGICVYAFLYNQNKNGKSFFAFLFAAALLIVWGWFMIPADMSVNTTIEAAQRGNYIW